MNFAFVYPTTMVVEYGDTHEYRRCLRNLFQMQSDNYKGVTEDDAYDEETRDEMEYDDIAAVTALDAIYAKTRDNEVFRELYRHGAATMLSEDPEIGLAVLMSYDYLRLFHRCLIWFVENSTKFTRESSVFKELVAKLV